MSPANAQMAAELSEKSIEQAKTDIGTLVNNNDYADFTFVFPMSANRQLPVHRAILGVRSPVFRAMFTADTADRRTGTVKI